MNLFCHSARRAPAARVASKDRRGATLVLIAVMSSALVSLGVLVINWSYIELTNTQLRSATDAAAKAAVVALSQTQQQDDARDAARAIAAQYRIGGQQLTLSDGDIEFGNGVPDGSGGYDFVAGQLPLNCARVVGQCGGNSATAAVPVLFAHLLPEDSFNLEKDAVAGRYDHDVCVVVDRSGSMAWDLTGVDFSYPDEYQDDSTVQNYFRPPHPTGSRWAKLIDALEVFRQVVDRRDLNARIGLVSYSSNYTFGLFHSATVTTDQTMSPDTYRFVDAARAISLNPIIGDTNIGAGIDRGVSVITDPAFSRMTANRTIVLLSDGRRTEGADPIGRAQLAAGQRITVHAVSFGDGADQNVMQQIAAITGGNHYHANSGAELEEAFEQIAEELPAVLIQ
ncbi:vWA domain-containing protein [Botrimarina mediterranea]|uniref:von Willebrand factor type A domain protein n=1 Tax=Botrimarina mediterranea TaxID=2528022 RepID=A0A518K6C5_9BACT|nr:vWA domain-containing protein [Botrimarina mediterranea]QDV73344.1 von Willebrand factor type A domain protein [Botrimarina mediterranea]QDV77861.1 von Willebrand factor type A domain protein [Planctomycetes bacterium K2D]